MSRRLDWKTDGAMWPHRSRSRFVEAAGLRWHLQSWGDPGHGDGEGSNPTLVLLHGSGGSTHSWAPLAPLLEDRGRSVFTMDLPGHAFTGLPADGDDTILSLDRMVRAVDELLAQAGAEPSAFVGHSAGAALALSLARLRDTVVPVVGICPALVATRDMPDGPFPDLAAGAFRSRFVAHLASGLVRHTRGLDSVLESTGSEVSETSRRCFRILSGNSDHVNATLTLFSRWDPKAVQEALADHEGRVLLVAGSNDRWVSPEAVATAHDHLPDSLLVELPGVGHLAHEEAPAEVAKHVLAFLGEADGGVVGD